MRARKGLLGDAVGERLEGVGGVHVRAYERMILEREEEKLGMGKMRLILVKTEMPVTVTPRENDWCAWLFQRTCQCIQTSVYPRYPS